MDLHKKIKSLAPIFDSKFCDLSTFFNKSVLMSQKFLQIFDIFALTGNSCQCFMSDYLSFFIVFNALSDQRLILSATDLTQNKADFML